MKTKIVKPGRAARPDEPQGAAGHPGMGRIMANARLHFVCFPHKAVSKFCQSGSRWGHSFCFKMKQTGS